MRRLLVAVVAFATGLQTAHADIATTADIPSGDALEERLLGQRVAPERGPGGQMLSFLDDGVVRKEAPGTPDRLLEWHVQDQALCFKDGQEGFCFDVIKLTDHAMRLRPSDPQHGTRAEGYLFLNDAGVPLRDVVEYDDVLARSLFGRVITVEDVHPPESLKGSKTVFDFGSETIVALSVLNPSGNPALGGALGADLRYRSQGDTLCLAIDEKRNRCMQVEITGDTVRMVPIKKGDLVEKDAMVGAIE